MDVHVLETGDLVAQGLKFRARIMQQAFGLEPDQDQDQWDQDAWHIIAVEDNSVIGYYRAMQDSSIGFCTEIEFDLAPLDIPRNQILEIGRAAADPRYPTTVLGLWRSVLDLAQQLGKRWIMGTASLKVADLDVYYLSEQWRNQYRYNQASHAVPRIPYRDRCPGQNQDAPSLIKTYEKIGAHIVSDLGWDPRFQTADVVTLLDYENISPTWRRKLIG